MNFYTWTLFTYTWTIIFEQDYWQQSLNYQYNTYLITLYWFIILLIVLFYTIFKKYLFFNNK